ncbi:hypothetical protein [Bremerella sp. P1]|uniref:hypothetical protein n=1 Tax=Bremerella sp. P1 TaxID=3026424 RepID=UPI002367BEA7|nr:hypothetical protein [Bremerella sp. P1]WDI42324.1 hypothetical protein PSR63_28125 [Bremerella sp. P1]
MRLSVLQLALVLGAFALPATVMSQEAMPVAAGPQAMPVGYAAQAMPHHGYAPAAYGGAYCPPGYGHHGFHHHQSRLPGYQGPVAGGHPHFGAMNYPKTNAPAVWPYTGMYYPNPQIPPGWKHVALEWDDGYWFLDFKSYKKPKHH